MFFCFIKILFTFAVVILLVVFILSILFTISFSTVFTGGYNAGAGLFTNLFVKFPNFEKSGTIFAAGKRERERERERERVFN